MQIDEEKRTLIKETLRIVEHELAQEAVARWDAESEADSETEE
jgi:hypothetical protein